MKGFADSRRNSTNGVQTLSPCIHLNPRSQRVFVNSTCEPYLIRRSDLNPSGVHGDRRPRDATGIATPFPVVPNESKQIFRSPTHSLLPGIPFDLNLSRLTGDSPVTLESKIVQIANTIRQSNQL